MSWDPDTYLAFAGPRERPALDLVERIPLPADEVVEVVDLGAGSGNLVALLRDRFPHAHVTAVDNDPTMLARAHRDVGGPRVTVVDADASTWTPPRPVDVLFSNAALHWVDDHATLLPRLLGQLRPGGALAVQMPRNHDAPSHRLLVEVAADPRWADQAVPAVRERPVHHADEYHRTLAPLAAHLDVWSTTYVQSLAAGDNGTHPVLAWMQGSTLRPVLAALPDDDARQAFLVTYGVRLAEAYPLEEDGSALFAFTRVFLVACSPAVTEAA